MIGKDKVLLKVYVPVDVKNRLDGAAELAGVSTSALVAAALTRACDNSERAMAIDYLRTAINLAQRVVVSALTEKLAELQAVKNE
jgi:hypothetical protein